MRCGEECEIMLVDVKSYAVLMTNSMRRGEIMCI